MKNTYRLTIPIVFAFLFACAEASNKKPLISSEKNKLDTLLITEDMRGNYGFSLKFDSLSNEKLIPRNVWINVHAKGRDTMVHILKHADLFLSSRDSNFRIQRISEYEYKFYINDNYCGFLPNGGPVKGQECLEIYPDIQPNDGYELSTYWLDKPIKFPERTTVLVLYEQLEEVK